METRVKDAENEIKKLPRWIAERLRPQFPSLSQLIESVEIDAPFSLIFSFLCVLVQCFSFVLGTSFAPTYFGVPSLSSFNMLSIFSYFRMVSQIFGHSNWQHLSGNITYILLIGPNCEREFGCYTICVIVLLTAISSSLSHIFFGPRNSIQLGASGVVFMFILLNSLIETKSHRVPLTFICQVSIWCTKEVLDHLFDQDGGISHLAHLTGALVGTLSGYYLQQQKEKNVVSKYLKVWSTKLKS
jgi:membrane associated rhomboid family serine protease